jgi:hypothetical protein
METKMRCPDCNAVIPQIDCKNCPPIIQIVCLKCGKVVNVENEFYEANKK